MSTLVRIIGQTFIFDHTITTVIIIIIVHISGYDVGPVLETEITDACLGHECRRGSQCVPNSFGKGYTCKCEIGWQGKYCEKGMYIQNSTFLSLN